MKGGLYKYCNWFCIASLRLLAGGKDLNTLECWSKSGWITRTPLSWIKCFNIKYWCTICTFLHAELGIEGFDHIIMMIKIIKILIIKNNDNIHHDTCLNTLF